MEIFEHMEVVDANDQHVGVVKKVDGDRIELVKDDAIDPPASLHRQEADSRRRG